MMRAALALFAMPALLSLCASASGPVTYLDNAHWSFETRGEWRTRVDHRDLVAMQHPWTESNTGDFAQASRMVRVPADWTGPVFLTFYCSDDYHTDDWRPDGSWLNAEGFVGHRFKQVFINERAAWSSDIADPVVRGESPVYRIPIDAKPGEAFRLGIIAYDREASTTLLEEDFFQPGDGPPDREGFDHAFRFQSNVYWGDFALVRGDAKPRAPRSPSEAKAAAVHDERWPLPLPGSATLDEPVRLQLHRTESLPSSGFPVRIGVPFPPGAVTERSEFRLQTIGEHAFFSGKNVLSRWPDGSVRWCLVDALIPKGLDALDLNLRKDWSDAPAAIKTTVAEDGLSVSANALNWDIVRGSWLGNATLNKRTVIRDGALILESAGVRASGYSERVRIISDEPHRATYLVEGRFEHGDDRVAGFRMYLTAFAQVPYIQIWMRLFNDTDAPLPVESLRMEFELNEAPRDSVAVGQGFDKPWEIAQDSADARVASFGDSGLPDQPLASDTPFYLQRGALTIAVPRFQQLHPKAAASREGAVAIDLIAAGDRPIVFTPGEAKSHTVWLAFGEDEPAAFAAAAERPPIWSAPDYYARSGALGLAATATGLPKFGAGLEASYAGKDWRQLGYSLGVRDFPDQVYMGKPGSWRNNYYDRLLGAWAAWTLTGSPEWHDRALEISALLSDVGIVHSDVPGKDWLGALHGPGENHVAGPWNPTLRVEGLVWTEKLTGWPELREEWLGVADFVVRTRAGANGGSVRQHAGPFAALVSAYAETGEPHFHGEAVERIELFRQNMDRRRGVWPDMHGSRVYRGNVPWMVAQLAGPLCRWYHLTGDLDAAQIVVGMAESMICENTPWDEPGNLSGYSHNPHFSITRSYDPIILPVLFTAYELTGDDFFLDAAKAQWYRWAKSDVFDSVFNTFWHTPWLAHLLRKHYPEALEETEAESP